MRVRRFRPSATLFAAAAAAAAAWFQGCASPRGAGRGARTLAAAVRSLSSVTAKRFPDADSVAVWQWEETRYEADGTYETTWTSLDKILTDRGLEQSRSVSIWNNDFYGSVSVLVARVHSPDGAVRDVNLAENLAEAVDTSSLAANIHDPNDKTWTLAFPGLRVGDAVETTIRRTVLKPRVEGVYADWLSFEQKGPVLWQGVRIDGPLSNPLRSRALRDAGPVSLSHSAATNAAEGRVVETWTAGEVPRYFPEPDMPPAHECTARLLLSTAADWESLSRWYARLCAPHLAATNAAMAEKVAEVVAEAGAEAADGSRAATVRALFDFVSRDVRYMGAMAESEAPGYEPHDVSLTFVNRYGVCRDKAALLVSMLRLAGIDAWPVLVHVGERKDPDVPQPYFNHAIVAADSGDPDAPYLLMDPTSETTRSLLPEYLCEKSYLVARDEGETIRETPPLPVEENLVAGETVVRFGAGGVVSAESELRFGGINDAAYRGHFASIPRDSVRAFCQRVLSAASPGAVLTGWALSPEHADLRSDLSPLVLGLSFELPLAAAGGGGPVRFFDPPRLAEAFAMASRVVGGLGLEERRFPLVTDFPCGFSEVVRFEGAVPAPVPETRFETPGLRYEDAVEVNSLHRSLLLLRSRFAPDEYAALRALREAEERSDRAPVFLLGTPAAGDGREALASALVRAVRAEPEDDVYLEFNRDEVDLSDLPRSWTVVTTRREKILTYAGRRKASDRTFAWQPPVEDLELLDARTILPDGTEVPVDPALDVFDGDQDWVADAPRYPAGRLKTVSFPKLEAGASVQYTVRRRMSGADFFAARFALGRAGSFGEDSVSVSGPERWLGLFRLREPLWPGLVATNPAVAAESGGTRTWTLAGGGPGTGVASERNLPSSDRLLPAVEASSQSAVERAMAVRAAFLALSDPAVETNAAALARSLVAADASVADKVRAIRDWTDLALRAAGPAWTTLPLSMLSGADETLAARYGHAADRQILRLAMARALGLAPEFRFYDGEWDVPRASDPDRLGETVLLSSIDSVSLAVPSGPGSGPRFFFLDGSSRFAPEGFDRRRDRAALVVREDDGATRAFFSSPVRPPQFAPGNEAADASEVRREFDLRPDGSARVSVRKRFRGAEAEAFRRRYSQMLPEERRRDAQELAAAFSQSARLVGGVEAVHPAGGPCELRYEVEVPDLAVERGGKLVMRLPRAELSPEAAPRVFPFSRASTVRECVENVLHVPAGWRVEARPDDGGAWIDPEFGVSLVRVVREDPQGADGRAALRISDTLCLGPAEFAPERYPEFLAEELRTRGPAASTVVLGPLDTGTDF